MHYPSSGALHEPRTRAGCPRMDPICMAWCTYCYRAPAGLRGSVGPAPPNPLPPAYGVKWMGLSSWHRSGCCSAGLKDSPAGPSSLFYKYIYIFFVARYRYLTFVLGAEGLGMGCPSTTELATLPFLLDVIFKTSHLPVYSDMAGSHTDQVLFYTL